MKFKSTITAAALLLFASGNVLSAQEKYDLAVISYQYDTPKPHIVSSINGDKFESIDIEKDELQGKVWGISMNPIIKRANKMQEEGWELVGGLEYSYNVSTGVTQMYYNLRKKR